MHFISLCLGIILWGGSFAEGGNDKETAKNTAGDPENESYAAWEQKEAQIAAVVLSGGLVEPEPLRNRVLSDLHQIRTIYGSSIISSENTPGQPYRLEEIQFRAPWVPDRFWITFDSTDFSKIDRKEYHAWDWLNSQMGLKGLRLHAQEQSVSLVFEHPYHPVRIRELYQGLPGVIRVETLESPGKGSQVHIRQDGKDFLYLFDKAWGNCLENCLHHEYWGFLSEDQGISYLGFWDPSQSQVPPDWWKPFAEKE